MSNYITIFSASSGPYAGHRTYWEVDGTEPVLRVVCPLGELGETCGTASVVDPDDLTTAIVQAKTLVEYLAAQGCRVHNTAPTPEDLATAINTKLLTTPPAQLGAAIQSVFAQSSTPSAPGGSSGTPLTPADEVLPPGEIQAPMGGELTGELAETDTGELEDAAAAG